VANANTKLKNPGSVTFYDIMPGNGAYDYHCEIFFLMLTLRQTDWL